MKKSKKLTLNERGTLMVEAIAMLGLIAMVTPTLYKKSAERLQEIQDINAAGQARMMNNVVETFIRNNFSDLMHETSSSANGTIKISYMDSSAAGYYNKGYSSYVPFGYAPGQIKNYGEPEIYVHRDGSSLVSYIYYPILVDVGKKRASRMASLVGANGGVISKGLTGTDPVTADGTGGAWQLENPMLQTIVGNETVSSMVENSLVVTSSEPISLSYDDNEKFLYRVPPDADGNESEYYHNTMVTDLYMGGHVESTSWANNSHDYYSIFNVRKLTLNTDCDRGDIGRSGGAGSSTCDPKVADLYIGKPTGMFNNSSATSPGIEWGNTGAAWIYGNLSALNDNFRLFRSGGGTNPSHGLEGYDEGMERVSSAYDVLEFSRRSGSSGIDELVVFHANNSSGSAQVGMLDDFVLAREGGSSGSGEYEFIVGKDDGSYGEGSFIHAYHDGTNNQHIVRINGEDGSQTGDNRETHINRAGGVVYINGGSSGTMKMETYINDEGGTLLAGKLGEWINASGKEGSAEVHLLNGGGLAAGADDRVFSVGSTGEEDNHMVWGNSSKVSLRGGAIRAYTTTGSLTDTDFIGGENAVTAYGDSLSGLGEGAVAITSRYTDILGATYLGMRDMSSDIDGVHYSRGDWTLGVAGSAFVDELLLAREAWFHNAGVAELHAGFSSFSEYQNSPKTGWLNVYEDKVVIRNRSLASSTVDASDSDTMFSATSSQVFLRDLAGAWASLDNGSARIGTDYNFFYADDEASGSANVVGSSLVNIYTSDNSADSSYVSIQHDAMNFFGHGVEANGSSYANTIAARAGKFYIETTNYGYGHEDNAQFYVDDEIVRTRFADFEVLDDSSKAVFQVKPNEAFDSGNDANVKVNGSLHVTGNEVIHIAPNTSSRASGDAENPHAMFEVDPEYVQIWARDESGNYAGGSTGAYYAMLKINPQDVNGASLDFADQNASVYIRKGAIELEASDSSIVGTVAADEGFGYIKANRFVSNAGQVVPDPVGGALTSKYDQYMVNPAYTSVMHDIKLTTRGGARLSDILPDYILKGVYNLSNNRKMSDSTQETSNVELEAHPFIGVIPFASCPPGYHNLATVMPISFRMGEAGEIIKDNGRFRINPNRQAAILQASSGDKGVIQPYLEEIDSYIYNDVLSTPDTHPGFSAQTLRRTEGWFWGLKAKYDSDQTTTDSKIQSNGPLVTEYAEDGTNWSAVASPLYFQQNTWLKTSVVPQERGWDAYMGFLYDVGVWGDSLGGVNGAGTVRSNYNETGNNEGGTDALAGSYYWNVFPVYTNTLEGHATVYCYFDRSAFNANGWENLVDQIDQLGALNGTNSSSTFRGLHDKSGAGEGYLNRLKDPSLHYDDPW